MPCDILKEVNKALLFQGWTVIRFWGKDIQKNIDECVKVVDEQVFGMMIIESGEKELLF